MSRRRFVRIGNTFVDPSNVVSVEGASGEEGACYLALSKGPVLRVDLPPEEAMVALGLWPDEVVAEERGGGYFETPTEGSLKVTIEGESKDVHRLRNWLHRVVETEGGIVTSEIGGENACCATFTIPPGQYPIPRDPR